MVVRNLDTALLRSFVTVAESGTVTAAARQLNLTQAAVSQHVRRLEHQLQTSLFRREARRLVIDAAGERLLPRARRLLVVNDEIRQVVAGADLAGQVRLGMAEDLVTPFLPPILARFDRACPRVCLDVVGATSRELLAALADGELDLCLTTETGLGAGATTLMREPLTWIQKVDGLAAARRPLPLAIGDGKCAFRAPVMAALGDAGVDFRIICDSNQVLTVNAMLDADLAVSVALPHALGARQAPVPVAVGLPPLPVFNVNLYLAGGSLAPAVGELAAHIREGMVAGARP